ncbi:hypothetical protein P5673_030606, partial [Acropora cervicornis]
MWSKWKCMFLSIVDKHAPLRTMRKDLAINELTSRKSGKELVMSLKVNGASTTNPTMLSNEFNNHFATIISSSD